MEQMRQAALRAVLRCCNQELQQLVSCGAAPEEHLGLPVSVVKLADTEPELVAALYARPREVINLLDEAAVQAQREVIKVMMQQQQQQHEKGAAAPPGPLLAYDNVHVRLVGLPSALDPRVTPLRPPPSRLGCVQLHQLLSISGTVVRTGPLRMWERLQVYECSKCKERFYLKCALEDGGSVQVPETCPRQVPQPCNGNKFRKVPDTNVYSGYQEVRLQAAAACLGLGEPPASLTAVLQDELADSVRPGDSVDVLGVLVHRWLSTTPGQRCEVELVLLANNVTARNSKAAGTFGGAAGQGLPPLPGPPLPSHPDITGNTMSSSTELHAIFEDFWRAHRERPLQGRNKILAGVCPGVAGLLPVKLAAMLVLLGGVARRDDGGTHIRGELHLLLVGDPGTGKSQIMKWACRASPGRAVMTTGKGSSGAGLTVAAVREGGSWALEAGALVLADGGLCCIDEFDGIRAQERAVVHEAMEQQTVHVAKAGLVTSVSTRTSIIGAINPRPAVLHASMPWASRPLTDVTGLEGPLLSRFDLVLLLADPRHPDWDRTVAGHVLARSAAAAPSGVGDGELATGAAALLPSCSGPALPLALPSTEALSATPPEPRHVNVTMVAPAGARRGGAQGSGFAEGSQAAGGGARVTIAEMVAARLGGGGDGAGGGMGAAVAPGTSVSGVVAAAQGRLGPFGSQQQTARAGMASSVTAPNGEVKCGSSSRNSSAWTLDVIRAYIDWAKQRPAPIMSPEAERVLVAYYGAMRRAEERSMARSTIRALESLIRVSQAHARLMGCSIVAQRDAVVAVALADASLQLLHVPGGDSVTCARFPADPDAELEAQSRVVLTALGLAHMLPQQHFLTMG